MSVPWLTDMAGRLCAAGLLEYRKYYGVKLTTTGEKLAQNVLQRHQLIELSPFSKSSLSGSRLASLYYLNSIGG